MLQPLTQVGPRKCQPPISCPPHTHDLCLASHKVAWGCKNLFSRQPPGSHRTPVSRSLSSPLPGWALPQTDLSPSPRTQESPSCPVPRSKTSSPLLRAHPCWPPPRPPRREPYSPDRTHHPSPPVPAGRTRTKCGLEAWPRREGGLGGCEKWGVREESRVCTAQGSKSGSRCPTGSLQCPWLPIARPHPPPCRSPGTQAVVAASLNPSGGPCSGSQRPPGGGARSLGNAIGPFSGAGRFHVRSLADTHRLRPAPSAALANQVWSRGRDLALSSPIGSRLCRSALEVLKPCGAGRGLEEG